MRLFLPLIFLSFLSAGLMPKSGLCQAVLATSPYVENFNNIASGLPAGFTVRTGATATVPGVNATVTSAPTAWNNSTGAFKNMASATGLSATSTTTEQNNSTNRSLGLRQTAAFGDPGGAFVFQIANTTNKTNFKLDFKLQSLDASVTRIATWKVDYGIGANPSSFTDVPTITGDVSTGGTAFKNSPVSVDFSNTLDNVSDVVTIRIITIVATTGAGNRPTSAIDDFTLSWTEGVSTTPILILNDNGNTSLNFPSTSINSSTPTQSYTLRGENLIAPVSITAPASFLISDDSVNYGNFLTVPVSELTSNKIIYVKFQPVTAGIATGTIINTSQNATNKAITVTGEGLDPNNLSFDFNACSSSGSPGSGFSSISITGVQRWACSGFGQNGTKGVDMNGYAGGALDNEDWLISPALLIGSLNLPILRFYSRGEFTGPSLQLLVSTDYDGTSNPNSATWTDLQATFPLLTNTWTLTDGINLSAYKSFSHIYIAFKYSSSPELGAARWTLDDISITDRTTLLSASPLSLDFSEIPVGSSSTGLPVKIQAIGYGAVTLLAPTEYQLSADNVSFTNTITVPASQSEAGTTIYVRLTPASKELKIAGKLNVTGLLLDSNIVSLTGSSFPKSETFDLAAYNLSFFGSTPDNNPTPEKIQTQVNNIATVFKRLNMDVVGFEEMSNDNALATLIQQLPGYQSVTSPRWSYSFDPPDPTFPPQKIGFIYNASTVQLVDQRVMFESLYDSARNGTTARLNTYPTGTPSSFWSSGRLPFMATFDVNIKGVMQRFRIIDIHAKSASDAASYNRRVFDVRVLKDSLDAYYPNDNIVLIGDYNDRVIGSIFAGSPSPYKIFVDDGADYAALTLPLDSAGKVSFISGTGLIDHIIISNELTDNYISSSTDIEDARAYIPNYNATTASDHLPVFTRFSLSVDIPLPVNISHFEAHQVKNQVNLSWTTATESGNSHFVVERSKDAVNFIPVARVNGAAISNIPINYESVDSFPYSGANYYRLRQVDINGKETLSQIVLVNMLMKEREALRVYPNPVTGNFQIDLTSRLKNFSALITSADGKFVMRANGSITDINRQINKQINKFKRGLYVLQFNNQSEWHTVKFIKE